MVEKQQMSLDDVDEVRRIVLNGLKGYRARVFLFGSWAKGDAGRTSDIDFAVLPLDPFPAESPLLRCALVVGRGTA